MKPFFFISLLCVSLFSIAQADSTLQHAKNTATGSSTQKLNYPEDSLKKKDSAGYQNTITRPSRKDSFENITDSNITETNSVSTDSVYSVSVPFPLPKKILKWGGDTAFSRLLKLSGAKTSFTAVLKDGEPRTLNNNDALFYTLAAIVFFIAFIKQAFPKYFQNLFHLFFQPSFRQKHSGDQLLQGALPSLLLNLFFFVTGGLFIALAALEYKWVPLSFWWLALNCTVILAVIYLLKYIVISFAGWVFNSREAASVYVFIVFLTNKIIGLILLPLLILLAFSNQETKKIIITAAGCIAGVLLLYRYAVSLTVIRRQLKVSRLHFFIYLCAVEIMPVLVICRILISYSGKIFNF